MLPSSYIGRLHETQAVEPENDFWAHHLVDPGEGDPLR
jgi:hypothetical protein